MRNKGFTLLELLITVAILGIFAAVVMPRIGSGESIVVTGELDNVEGAFVGNVQRTIGSSNFHGSIVIKDSDGAYITSSTEDGQWSSFTEGRYEGKCVTATIFIYPKYRGKKAGTNHGAQLNKVWNCKEEE